MRALNAVPPTMTTRRRYSGAKVLSFKCIFTTRTYAHSETLSTRPIELITYVLHTHRTLFLSYSASSFSSSIERMPSGTGVTTPTISSFTSAAAISVFSSTTGSSAFGSGAFE